MTTGTKQVIYLGVVLLVGAFIGSQYEKRKAKKASGDTTTWGK